jgi:hypothetical protein
MLQLSATKVDPVVVIWRINDPCMTCIGIGFQVVDQMEYQSLIRG